MNDDWRSPRFRGRGGFSGVARGRGFGRGFSGGLSDTRRRPPYRPRSPFSGSGGELSVLFDHFLCSILTT